MGASVLPHRWLKTRNPSKDSKNDNQQSLHLYCTKPNSTDHHPHNRGEGPAVRYQFARYFQMRSATFHFEPRRICSYLPTMMTAVVLVLLWQPQTVRSLTPNLPPLPDGPRRRATIKNKKPAGTSNSPTPRDNNYHTSDFGARQNHPTSYDPSPPFLGPLELEQPWRDDAALVTPDSTATATTSRSFNVGRERIRHYYQRQNLALLPPKPLKPSSPTKQKLKAIVDHLAYHNAPVDVKEVCESVEFVLRTRKRLLGAVKQQQTQSQQQQQPRQKREPTAASCENGAHHTIHLYDLCCGHGLTGMLFGCCGSGSDDTKMSVILVDQRQPPSHAILLQLLVQVCPWMGEPNTVTYQEARLDSATTLAGLSSSPRIAEHEIATSQDSSFEQDTSRTTTNLVISTHACGALTDRVLELAASNTINDPPADGDNTANTNTQSARAAAVAVMPCCYTGTSQGAPYGIQRALGVAWAADIQRSYYLKAQGYHADFATIPRDITPMNRILIGEFKGSTKITKSR